MEDFETNDLEMALNLMTIRGFRKQRDSLIKFVLELQNDIRKGLSVDEKINEFVENIHDNLQEWYSIGMEESYPYYD